jgi:hypothetical protein
MFCCQKNSNRADLKHLSYLILNCDPRDCLAEIVMLCLRMQKDAEGCVAKQDDTRAKCGAVRSGHHLASAINLYQTPSPDVVRVSRPAYCTCINHSTPASLRSSLCMVKPAGHQACIQQTWIVHHRSHQPRRPLRMHSPTSPEHVESANAVGSNAMALCRNAPCARDTDATVCMTSIVGLA